MTFLLLVVLIALASIGAPLLSRGRVGFGLFSMVLVIAGGVPSTTTLVEFVAFTVPEGIVSSIPLVSAVFSSMHVISLSAQGVKRALSSSLPDARNAALGLRLEEQPTSWGRASMGSSTSAFSYRVVAGEPAGVWARTPTRVTLGWVLCGAALLLQILLIMPKEYATWPEIILLAALAAAGVSVQLIQRRVRFAAKLNEDASHRLLYVFDGFNPEFVLIPTPARSVAAIASPDSEEWSILEIPGKRYRVLVRSEEEGAAPRQSWPAAFFLGHSYGADSTR